MEKEEKQLEDIEEMEQEVSESKNTSKRRLRLNATKFKKVWPYLRIVKEGLIVWLAVFIVSEVVISGGLYERGIYLGILSLLVLLIANLSINLRRLSPNWSAGLWRGGIAAVTFALLDYLVINLALEGNSYIGYKFWATWVAYGLMILIPVAIWWLKGKKKITP